jgi:hypothetical protein
MMDIDCFQTVFTPVNNALKSLLKKKKRKDSIFVPPSTVSGKVCGGYEDKQDTAQMSTSLQGTHRFVPFTEIQSDQVYSVLFSPNSFSNAIVY